MTLLENSETSTSINGSNRTEGIRNYSGGDLIAGIKVGSPVFLRFLNMFEVVVFRKMDGCLVARGKLQP